MAQLKAGSLCSFEFGQSSLRQVFILLTNEILVVLLSPISFTHDGVFGLCLRFPQMFTHTSEPDAFLYFQECSAWHASMG